MIPDFEALPRGASTSRTIPRLYLSFASNQNTIKMEPIQEHSASFNEAFAREPILNHVGHLRIVTFHHREVRVSFEPDLGQVDDVDASTCRFGKRGHLLIDPALICEHGVAVDVVAIKHKNRNVLEGGRR